MTRSGRCPDDMDLERLAWWLESIDAGHTPDDWERAATRPPCDLSLASTSPPPPGADTLICHSRECFPCRDEIRILREMRHETVAGSTSGSEGKVIPLQPFRSRPVIVPGSGNRAAAAGSDNSGSESGEELGVYADEAEEIIVRVVRGDTEDSTIAHIIGHSMPAGCELVVDGEPHDVPESGIVRLTHPPREILFVRTPV